jgi:hypothetical protein
MSKYHGTNADYWNSTRAGINYRRIEQFSQLQTMR